MADVEESYETEVRRTVTKKAFKIEEVSISNKRKKKLAVPHRLRL
jgi:hypothetical protein